jgi:hypothetical protein
VTAAAVALGYSCVSRASSRWQLSRQSPVLLFGQRWMRAHDGYVPDPDSAWRFKIASDGCPDIGQMMAQKSSLDNEESFGSELSPLGVFQGTT